MARIQGDRKGLTVWFEDQAERRHLLSSEPDALQDWTGLVYRCIREQLYYRLGEEFRLYQYRTRAGALVPLVFETREGSLGLIPILDQEPSRAQKLAAHSLLSKLRNGCVLFVARANRFKSWSNRALQVPSSWLLWE
jgi:hypothetical protein